MCHGSIIGSALIAAQRGYRCGFCERIIPRGEEHVRHSIEAFDEEREDGSPRESVWRLHRKCAARWDALFDHIDGCPIEPERVLREYVRDHGWTAWRKSLRRAREYVRKIGRPRYATPAPAAGPTPKTERTEP